MQSDLSNPSKTVEFFIENKSSELSIEKVDTFIKNIKGVRSVEVNPVSGQTKVVLSDDSLFDKKLIEVQRMLFQAGYEIKINNTNGVQGVLFFGTMTLGFLFVAVVITLWFYYGSLPSLI